MPSFLRVFALCSSLCCIIATVTAQPLNCPELERAATALVQTQCADIALQSVCYGSPALEMSTLDESEAAFSIPGDAVALADVGSLVASIRDDAYGIARLEALAYAADAWALQPVTLLALGDVEITNRGTEGEGSLRTLTVAVEAEQGVNIRNNPQVDSSVIAAAARGSLLKVTGRTAGSDWVRIQLRNGRVGWVATTALNLSTADIEVMAEATGDDAETLVLFQPFAAFDFVSTTADARCAQAWESGVLLQATFETPLEVRVNDYLLLLSGTVFVQAPSMDVLQFFVLEGEVRYADQTIAASQTLTLSADELLEPRVRAYAFDRVVNLPLELLPRLIYIAVDLQTIITPAPQIDRSPIIDTLVTDPCVLTTGPGGANLRAGPGREFPLRGVLAFRETANPIGRATDRNNTNWWELAQNIWISGEVTVTGGDCVAVPQSARVPVLLPTATPAS